MAQVLTAGKVKALTEVGVYRVDHNLYAQIAPNGARSWLVRYMFKGKRRTMGLGPIRLVDLDKARFAANDAKRLALSGVDPLEKKRAEQAPSKPQNVVPTFKQCAADYVEAHAPGWKNAKHQLQWEATLRTYAEPVIGHLPVDRVTTEHVVTILKPLWTSKPETAGRLRGRIEHVLGAAEAAKHRAGPNPASWKGALRHLLPALSRVQTVTHHPAVPYAEAPAVYAALGERDGTAAAALRLLILTAARSGEVRGATWSEFDLTAKTWTVPASRMKAGKEHRVPLTDEALAALPRKQGKPGDLVFPGAISGKALSDMALLQLMRRLCTGGETPHGWRSTFRDWCAEKTGVPREIAEAALAHTIGNAVEAAYRRSDLLEKRRKLMEKWAAFIAGRAA